jgi:hypothetical protein
LAIIIFLAIPSLAKIHQDLGTWLKHLHLCRIVEAESTKGEVDKRLVDLIGFQDSIGLDALTEYQMAVQSYYFALQMHKEGTIYRNRMTNLFTSRMILMITCITSARHWSDLKSIRKAFVMQSLI